MSAATVAPLDFDRDGNDELFRVDSFQMTLVRQDGGYVSDGPNPGLATVRFPRIWAWDLDGDSVPEALVGSRAFGMAVETLALYAQDLGTRAVRTIAVETVAAKPGRDVSWAANHCRPAALGPGGAGELVVALQSGYGKQPRGLYVLDPRTGARRWFFPTGTNVRTLATADLDGDNRSEIIIGTDSPGNGCRENGFDDSRNYAFCLDPDGALRWRTELREVGAGGWVEAGFLRTRDGPSVLAVADGCILDSQGPDRLHLLDPATGGVLATDSTSVGGKLVKSGIADLDGDGNDELVLVNGSGAVELRDAVFARQRLFADPAGVARLLGFPAVPGSGRSLVAVATRDNELVVLDHRLAVLGRGIEVGPEDEVAWVRRGPADLPGLLVMSDRGTADQKRVCRFYHLALAAGPFPWALVSAGLAGLLLAAFGLVLYLRGTYREQVRYLARGLVAKAGIIELDRRGRVVAANDAARELLGEERTRGRVLAEVAEGPDFAALRDCFERVRSGAVRTADCELAVTRAGRARTILARVMRVRQRGFLVSFEDLSAVEYARRVAAWGPVAQRLAHGIKTPLSTIRLTGQQLEEEGDAETGRLLREEADRLRQMTDGFMRLADFESPRLEPGDLNRLVRRVVDEQGVELMPELALELELAGNLPKVRMDEEKLGPAIANLVDNAAAAMGRKGRLRLVTRRNGEGMVELLVADSGPGIPEAWLGRLFEPFFTRKPGGTGLGLSIVKKVVEDHGGIIAVASRVGEGTTFTLCLPVAKEVA